MRRFPRIPRQRYFDALGTAICIAEVGFLGGRPFVLAFAAALFGLRFTVPLDEKRQREKE